MKCTFLLLLPLFANFKVCAQDSTFLSAKDTGLSTVSRADTSYRFGTLLNDDPVFNPRYPIAPTAFRVFTTNVVNWASSRYIFKYDWAYISAKSWKYNLQKGFEWDADRFGTNFIGHPHTGSTYFSVGRSAGYNYYQSFLFAVEGSVMWEYFGENTRPSVNDIINTPISGAFLGEILYRLSSNILDDRTRGRERVFREIFAGIVNPTRALNRLTQGKMFRHTTKEVYQKEPLNLTFSAGAIQIDDLRNKNGKKVNNIIVNMQLDYGSPFENRHRKAFDLFRFRTELSYGENTKLLGNVNGYGILTGKNLHGNRLLAGVFQHFDYWNNSLFQVGAIGFGGGLISRIKVSNKSNIFSTIHLSVVPMAGNNTRFGPDTSDYRQYNFGGGLEAKAEETFNIGNKATIGFTGFYYFLHTYNGIPGNSLVGILKPNVTLQIYRNLRIGFEHFIYKNDRFLTDDKGPNLHLSRKEERVFLQLFLEDPKRRGRYN